MMLEQGDLIELDFDPTLGHEPRKMRPAVVLSVGFFNNVLSSLVVVCPITSNVNGHPLHVEIAEGNSVDGCVCTEAVRAVDLASPMRHARSLGSALDEETMSRVLEAIGGIFGI